MAQDQWLIQLFQDGLTATSDGSTLTLANDQVTIELGVVLDARLPQRLSGWAARRLRLLVPCVSCPDVGAPGRGVPHHVEALEVLAVRSFSLARPANAASKVKRTPDIQLASTHTVPDLPQMKVAISRTTKSHPHESLD